MSSNTKFRQSVINGADLQKQSMASPAVNDEVDCDNSKLLQSASNSRSKKKKIKQEKQTFKLINYNSPSKLNLLVLSPELEPKKA